MEKLKAPWPDFKGNDIFEGDIILHPSGENGTVCYIDNNDPKWVVDYGDDFHSRLSLQIGDKGQAVVVKYKMYCVISKESLARMQGIRGKIMAQSGHAFLHAFWNAEELFPEDAKAYKDSEHAYKITLVTEKDSDLLDLALEYGQICGVTVVNDAGLTVFKKESTLTCIGIGPIRSDKISDSLKNLKVLT